MWLIKAINMLIFFTLILFNVAGAGSEWDPGAGAGYGMELRQLIQGGSHYCAFPGVCAPQICAQGRGGLLLQSGTLCPTAFGAACWLHCVPCPPTSMLSYSSQGNSSRVQSPSPQRHPTSTPHPYPWGACSGRSI